LQKLVGGLVGLILAMLLETLLLILRTNFSPELESSKRQRDSSMQEQTADSGHDPGQSAAAGTGRHQRQFVIGSGTATSLQEKKQL
jgi:hypothetical protein